MNDDTMKLFKKGQTIKKGVKLILEGSAPPSTGNHFHITANIGKYYGFKKNSNNKWCYTYEKSLLPNEAFFIDEKVKILNSRHYVFKQVPKSVGIPVKRDETKKQIKVNVTDLRTRKSPNGEIINYITPGIYDILQEDNSWVRIGNGIWIKYDSKWSIIYESKKEEPKPIVEQSKEDIVEEIKETIETPKIEKSKVRLLFEKVLDLLNKIFKSKG